MGKKPARSAPNKIIIKVNENPLDKAAAKYIAMFSKNAASFKKGSISKTERQCGCNGKYRLLIL